MSDENIIRLCKKRVFKMHVHLVFVTKYRRNVFTKEVIDDLGDIFAGVCADFEAQLIEFDGEDDHLRHIMHYPTKALVSALVNSLKGVSSQMIRKKDYPSIRKKETVGWCLIVAQLFCWKLWRSSYRDCQAVH